RSESPARLTSSSRRETGRILERASPARSRPAWPARASVRPDLDTLRGRLRFSALRHGDGQHALFEGRFDPIGIDSLRQREAPLEGAVTAFREVVALLLFLRFLLLLALDGENAVGGDDLDVLLAEAGKFRRQLVAAVLLHDVGSRERAKGAPRRGERLEQRARP